MHNNRLTFVVPVNNDHIYNNNFLSSPLLKKNNNIYILKQEFFQSASLAYNNAIQKSENDIMVFTHQDMVFPVNWEYDLQNSIKYLNNIDPRWGILGCYGKVEDGHHGKGHGYLYCNGNKKLLGKPFSHPIQVQTLDEVVLIIKKSSGLRFDNLLPHYHLYGADICMTAETKGMKCYAISAFCLHNTEKISYLTKEFFECYNYLKYKWRNKLPIYHSCINLENNDWKNVIIYKYYRKYKHIITNLFFKNRLDERVRSDNPIHLLYELENIFKIEL